jgi:hypothetical protein
MNMQEVNAKLTELGYKSVAPWFKFRELGWAAKYVSKDSEYFLATVSFTTKQFSLEILKSIEMHHCPDNSFNNY